MRSVSWKDFFPDFQLTALEYISTFLKKAVLYTSTRMHCKAGKIYEAYSVLPRNDPEMVFVTGATKTASTI